MARHFSRKQSLTLSSLQSSRIWPSIVKSCRAPSTKTSRGTSTNRDEKRKTRWKHSPPGGRREIPSTDATDAFVRNTQQTCAQQERSPHTSHRCSKETTSVSSTFQNKALKSHIEDVIVVVDLDAGPGLVGALDDGGGAAAGALEGDGLLLGAVHLDKGSKKGGKKTRTDRKKLKTRWKKSLVPAPPAYTKNKRRHFTAVHRLQPSSALEYSSVVHGTQPYTNGKGEQSRWHRDLPGS